MKLYHKNVSSTTTTASELHEPKYPLLFPATTSTTASTTRASKLLQAAAYKPAYISVQKHL